MPAFAALDGPSTAHAQAPPNNILGVQDRLELDTYEVPFSWEHLPDGLKPGDRFRVVFITSSGRDASQRHQAHYHNFVRQRAQGASLPNWQHYRAYVCGSEPNPRGGGGWMPTHLAMNLGIALNNFHPLKGTTTNDTSDDDFPATYDTASPLIRNPFNAPVYWLNGVKLYDNTVGLLNSYGPRTLPASGKPGRDENGNEKNPDNVWTGCLSDKPGSLHTDLGSAQVSSRNPTQGTTTKRASSNSASFYAVSPVYVVGPYEDQIKMAKNKIIFNAKEEGRYTFGLKLQPERDVVVTARVAKSAQHFDTSDNVRLSTTSGTAYADASKSLTLTFTPANWQTDQTIYIIPKPGARTYSGMYTINHTFSGAVTDRDWHWARNNGYAYHTKHTVKGQVKIPKVTTVPNIVLNPATPSFSGMAPNAEETFTVKLSGPPKGGHATVYVSPVDDLTREQARCKFSNPDAYCDSYNKIIRDSNNNPVYKWQFSVPPLTLWHGNNNACLTSPKGGTCHNHVRDGKFSKPTSSPYIKLKFNGNNWDTEQTVTVRRTGNSFRSHTDRTGTLYVSFAHPWITRTNFKTHDKTKSISVSLNTVRFQNSPSQEIEFFGIEEHDGVPKQMSDSEVQQLTQGTQQQQQAFVPDATVVANVRSYAAETHRGTTHVERWQRVLIGLGVETYPGLTAMTSTEAQKYADYGWTRWDPVVTELGKAEAAATQQPVQPPPPPPPTPELTISGGAGVTEGQGAVFTITANPAPTSQLSVSVNVSQLGDFASVGAQTVVIAANTSSAILHVSTTDDAVDEPNGSVTASLLSGSGYNVGAASSATIAVSDNDDAPPPPPPPPPPPDPQLTISGGAGVTEGSDAVFTITASPAATSSLTVNLSTSQSGDFAASLPSTLTLTGSAATLRVSTVDDSTDEPNGSITVALTSGSGYTVGSSSAATVNVTDNDDPPPPPNTQDGNAKADLITRLQALANEYQGKDFMVYFRADDTLRALRGEDSLASNPAIAPYHFRAAIQAAYAVGDSDAATLFAEARDFLGVPEV